MTNTPGKTSLASKLFDALTAVILTTILASIVIGLLANTWLQILAVIVALIVLVALTWAVLAWWHHTRYW